MLGTVVNVCGRSPTIASSALLYLLARLFLENKEKKTEPISYSIEMISIILKYDSPFWHNWMVDSTFYTKKISPLGHRLHFIIHLYNVSRTFFPSSWGQTFLITRNWKKKSTPSNARKRRRAWRLSISTHTFCNLRQFHFKIFYMPNFSW